MIALWRKTWEIRQVWQVAKTPRKALKPLRIAFRALSVFLVWSALGARGPGFKSPRPDHPASLCLTQFVGATEDKLSLACRERATGRKLQRRRVVALRSPSLAEGSGLRMASRQLRSRQPAHVMMAGRSGDGGERALCGQSGRAGQEHVRVRRRDRGGEKPAGVGFDAKVQQVNFNSISVLGATARLRPVQARIQPRPSERCLSVPLPARRLRGRQQFLCDIPGSPVAPFCLDQAYSL